MGAGNGFRSGSSIALTIITTAARSVRLVPGRGPPLP